MARTLIPTVVAAANKVGVELTASDVAADAANGMYFVNAGGAQTILIVQSASASGADVTIVSVADPYGRTGDIGPATVGAAATVAFGPFEPLLFNQPGGTININLASVTGTVTLVAMKVPNL